MLVGDGSGMRGRVNASVISFAKVDARQEEKQQLLHVKENRCNIDNKRKGRQKGKRGREM